MRLIWKLLRRHLSVAQFVGFFITNLIGIAIVLSAIQVYRDVSELYNQPDSFMKNDYIIISKKINTLKVLGIGKTEFTPEEIEELREQPFVLNVGTFTPALYRIKASVGVGSIGMSTYMFFESVPDEFIDVRADQWTFKEGDERIPIIIPKNYLNLYNYGFAQSQGLPQISQDLFGAIDIDLRVTGNGHGDEFKGYIAGFSSRLNTILVPEAFIKWSNERYSPDEQPSVSRIIMEVNNAADKTIHEYIAAKGYETEGDSMDAGKTAYFMRLITGAVIGVGVVITLLSFFILMLSVFLLLQKNTEKLRTLILLGYTPSYVSMPYRFLTLALNMVSFVVAMLFVSWFRGRYIENMLALSSDFQDKGVLMTAAIGLVIVVTISAVNWIAISRKTTALWKE